MMVSSRSLAVGLLLACVCVSVSAEDQCQGTFCFKVFSRRFRLTLNLFNSFFADSDDPIPIEDYIRQAGYPVECHNITTEDGYVLMYHRIPHGKLSQDDDAKRTPVLVQHGLLGASSSWVLSPNPLAFLLADEGFDVWLGNARGNTYSRRHVEYDPDKDKKKFWNFSWHEMGYYDLPASIDYILNKTGHEKLPYIGHSMGTTMYFVLGATRPEYMDKITAMVAMAPVAFLWNMKSPLAKVFMDLHIPLGMYVKLFGMYEVFPYSPNMLWVDQNICARPGLQFLCREILNSIGGFDDKEINRTALTTILQYTPAGSSYKDMEHYRQISKKGTNFQRFDYGFFGNLNVYGSTSPPVYNMTNIHAPMYVYYAINDYLADPEDVHRAVEHLPNVKRVTKVPNDKFNHLDFMWAIDAKTLLYNDVISTLVNITSLGPEKTANIVDSDAITNSASATYFDTFLIN